MFIRTRGCAITPPFYIACITISGLPLSDGLFCSVQLLFHSVDENRDSTIDPAEFLAYMTRGTSDDNTGGHPAMWQALSRQKFNSIDSDRSGYITLPEALHSADKFLQLDSSRKSMDSELQGDGSEASSVPLKSYQQALDKLSEKGAVQGGGAEVSRHDEMSLSAKLEGALRNKLDSGGGGHVERRTDSLSSLRYGRKGS